MIGRTRAGAKEVGTGNGEVRVAPPISHPPLKHVVPGCTGAPEGLSLAARGSAGNRDSSASRMPHSANQLLPSPHPLRGP